MFYLVSRIQQHAGKGCSNESGRAGDQYGGFLFHSNETRICASMLIKVRNSIPFAFINAMLFQLLSLLWMKVPNKILYIPIALVNAQL